MIFAELVGHQRAKELLSRALARATVHSGYIFHGPTGVGKYLAAEQFVRSWLCVRAEPAPCGLCPSCTAFRGPAHPDFLKLTPEDKKKSISIDQVRDLGTWIAQSPVLGGHKAAILDPADKLRDEGANALLKTLEEPPPGRIIVLIATRPGALPPTVRSRCQQVSFGALSDDEVAEVLRRHGWPAGSARQGAALADGSPGTALGVDGSLCRETADAVRGLLEALATGEYGPALAFAEAVGDVRERALASLQALIGYSRLAARRSLGDTGVDPGSVPILLRRMETRQIERFMAVALETHRRLEGDRPPNAKLALANLFAGPFELGARQ